MKNSSIIFTLSLLVTLHVYAAEEAYDPFGGYKAVQAEGKIYFYTQIIDGVWWIVAPSGNVFISKGVNHVSYTADFSPALGYSPYAQVTRKKYGNQGTWADAAIERLRKWNINTLGSWSNKILYSRKMPYTVNLNIAAQAGGDWEQGVFPDVYSKKFERTADRIARLECKPRRKDVYLLGYFTDNELRWGPDWRGDTSLLIEYLRLPKESAGHQKAIQFLRLTYSTVKQLNGAWKTNATAFQELAAIQEFSESEQKKRDEAEFLYVTAERYFEVCHNAIIKSDINHMILGVRFAGKAPEPVLRALRNYVDIVSFNTYNKRPPNKSLREIHDLTGRPLMITEFSFKARDSGLPNTKGAGKPVATQQDRAQHFETFVTELMQLTYMVGYHWFEYADEPKEGRFDGENSNFGLVNIEDEPWETLVAKMTEVNKRVEAIHMKSADNK